MLDLIIFLTLLALGYGFGRYAEVTHYRDIIRREQQLNAVPAVASRILPTDQQYETPMVTGSVVISVDYFKRFVAGLRNLVGGRITSYESLLDRGRREAVLRMKQEAYRQGAAYVFNIKLETSRVFQNDRGGVGCVEVIAYGTALIPAGNAVAD